MPKKAIMGPSISGFSRERNRFVSESPPRRRICAVMVVPILAPMMTPTAWRSFKIPECHQHLYTLTP